ncbi:hypothetical protein [Lentzea sp. NPDC059081]|uniref:hypothetical protein n=1 Tax=Lentzea sp. NPDC059081 TaxID=3346719 RepID=UPI0036B6E64C
MTLNPEHVAEAATRVVDAVTARLDTAHHEWEPGAVFAHAALAELDRVLDENPGLQLNRDFLARIADRVAATVPASATSVPAQEPRYATVLVADTQVQGKNLVDALSLHRPTTLVVSHPDQLRGRLLPEDIEVIDRTSGMNVATRREIDKHLELCKTASR